MDDAAFTLDNVNTTKRERRNVNEGNAMYSENEYLKSIENYNKALTLNPHSELVLYNLADAMYAYSRQLQVKQPEQPAASSGVDLSQADGNAASANQEDKSALLANYSQKADSIFRMLASGAYNSLIKEYASYNAGNIAYNDKNYTLSIEMYKSALRLNPDNENARQNLRLAQLKLQDQQQNQNNDNQDQDKDQDKEKDKEKDKQQDQPNQDQQQNQNQQPQQPQPPQQISDQNAEQILKAMENAERDTRQRLEKQPKRINPKYIEKPW